MANDPEGLPVTRPLPDWQALLAYLEHWRTDYVDDGTAESLEDAEHASVIKTALERQIPWVDGEWPANADKATLTVLFSADQWRHILANLELQIPLYEELFGDALFVRDLMDGISSQTGSV